MHAVLARLLKLSGLLLLAYLPALQAAPLLPALSLDPRETSVSGLSAGGFMAVQFQLAHAATVKGAGIIAGGPYYCARNEVMRAVSRCSCTGEPGIPCQASETSTEVPALLEATRRAAAANQIDPTAHLTRQRVITIAGAQDKKVPPAIARQLDAYYLAAGLPAGQLASVRLPQAAHTLPTRDRGLACNAEQPPYIGQCGYDSAGAILGWIHGDPQAPGADPARPESWLKPRNDGPPRGSFQTFDQSTYRTRSTWRTLLWGNGLDDTGWVYIPDDCARGEACRLHIALHGCRQGQGYPRAAGDDFVHSAGYDRWADTNHLVILFPQVTTIPFINPNGCWDWWGYTGPDYATREGAQIRALHAMAARLSSAARAR